MIKNTVQRMVFDGDQWQPTGEPIDVEVVPIVTTCRRLIDGKLSEEITGVQLVPAAAYAEVMAAGNE